VFTELTCRKSLRNIEVCPGALHVFAPTLARSRSGNTVQISWSANAAGFLLQSATNIAAPNWHTVTRALMVLNGQNTLTVTNAPGSQFFRLKR
jgi:hypothetical protein